MGFAPEQVDRMTLWEFLACADGYAEAHGAKQPRVETIDDERLRELGIEGFD